MRIELACIVPILCITQSVDWLTAAELKELANKTKEVPILQNDATRMSTPFLARFLPPSLSFARRHLDYHLGAFLLQPLAEQQPRWSESDGERRRKVRPGQAGARPRAS